MNLKRVRLEATLGPAPPVFYVTLAGWEFKTRRILCHSPMATTSG